MNIQIAAVATLPSAVKMVIVQKNGAPGTQEPPSAQIDPKSPQISPNLPKSRAVLSIHFKNEHSDRSGFDSAIGIQNGDRQEKRRPRGPSPQEPGVYQMTPKKNRSRVFFLFSKRKRNSFSLFARAAREKFQKIGKKSGFHLFECRFLCPHLKTALCWFPPLT